MGNVMKRICIIGSTTSAVLATCSFAAAADLPANMPIKAPVRAAIYDWTGFYVGGQVGYGQGSFGPGTNPIPEQAVFFPHSVTGLMSGFQAGYNLQLPNRVVLGVEADASFASPIDRPKLGLAPFNTTLEYAATARGRIGYAFGTILPYVTGGLAWGQTRVNINADHGRMPAACIRHGCFRTSAGRPASALKWPLAAIGPLRSNTTISTWRAGPMVSAMQCFRTSTLIPGFTPSRSG